MKISNKEFEKTIAKFQEGGEMPAGAPAAEAPAGAPEGGAPAGGDPMQELLMACQQVLETQDCNLAMQVVQAVMQMLGGGAPAPEAAPAGTEPVYKMGGKLAKVIKK
jgi:hypothetical protein